MHRHAVHVQAAAIVTAAVAGFVDAIGFLALGGFFVSFMSGNSTRLGVALAAGSGDAAIALGLIAAFVGGVALGVLVADAIGAWKRRGVMTLVGAGLALAAWLEPGLGEGLVLASAMGAANAGFQHKGETTFGVTHMTGALVKIGTGLARVALGQDRYSWIRPLLLWLALLGGAATGAFAHIELADNALWIGSIVTLLIAAASPAEHA